LKISDDPRFEERPSTSLRNLGVAAAGRMLIDERCPG
jgi:hypothetical protein